MKAARAIFCAVALLLSAAGGLAAEKWTTYSNCTLIANPANDGDSFHVQCGRRKYLFRLYFVDCPETDKAFPVRVAEQAAYWGISDASAVRLGQTAAEFTRTFLKDPFTVHTKREDARGRSDKPRYYAIVERRGVYLTEALVANGLARAFGAYTDLPDGTEIRAYWKHLRQVELKAKREKRGGWDDPKQSLPGR